MTDLDTALVRLVEYLEHDEREHFEEMLNDGEDTASHIYHAVKVVADYLKSRGIAYRDPHAEMLAEVAAAFEAKGVSIES